MPSEDELLAMYRNETAETMEYAFHENVAWQTAKAYLRGRRFTERVVSIIDVGCHTGRFLANLPGNFDRYGVEAEGRPASVARQAHGVNIIAERIDVVPPVWREKFDVVTMFDVLEHLPDPSKGVELALRLLKPNGEVIFSTGDADAWTWRRLGARHWYLQTAQHLAVASRAYVQWLAQKNHWKVETVKRIAHTRASRGVKLRQAIELLHFASKGRGGTSRIVHRLLQELPGFKGLRHRESVPWTMGLRDHMLIVIRKSDCP